MLAVIMAPEPHFAIRGWAGPPATLTGVILVRAQRTGIAAPRGTGPA